MLRQRACKQDKPAGGRFDRIATLYARLAVARSTPRVSRFGVLIWQACQINFTSDLTALSYPCIT